MCSISSNSSIYVLLLKCFSNKFHQIPPMILKICSNFLFTHLFRLPCGRMISRFPIVVYKLKLSPLTVFLLDVFSTFSTYLVRSSRNFTNRFCGTLNPSEILHRFTWFNLQVVPNSSLNKPQKNFPLFLPPSPFSKSFFSCYTESSAFTAAFCPIPIIILFITIMKTWYFLIFFRVWRRPNSHKSIFHVDYQEK